MKNWFENKALLVPVDFSDDSIKSVDEALAMADSADKVHVVHVAADLDVTTPGVVWESLTEDVQRKNVNEAFAKYFSDARYGGLNFHVSFGDAGHRIVEQAEAIKADAIVMASHGRTGFRRLLIGSVAERVLRLAHLPVVMLRH